MEGKLYSSKSGTLVSGGVTLPTGGGGGSGSSASVTLKNLLDSNILTVTVGRDVNLKFSFTSSEDDSGGLFWRVQTSGTYHPDQPNIEYYVCFGFCI